MSESGTPDTTVRQQLLAAAIEAASLHGIARLSMADVAQRSGLSRQTLYRHFPSKEVLLAEAVAIETITLIDTVRAAATEHCDPVDSLEAGLLAALHAAREHPLLDRLIRTEPETLLPLLSTDGGPVLGMVRGVVAAIVTERAIVSVEDLDQVELRRFADLVTRLLVSYAISAPDDPPEIVAAYVARFLINGVSHPFATASTGAPS